ncbi:isoaspartyl peptidase/L-asparaginase family protein [Idiomarina xiamenensis]|uniref:Isoaspartyl peptidase n=1 Tax=Idiomarina xiamenensis 10-D-4 TaxID=740709 RepID=K2KWQ0_9GAMM|nr:isoaspartyl peptidase/L-asparaginase [Idiomarina xiamenensis]EKE86919.1 asparaginase [Idiomarina xiamenensis 10-D-4]
MKAASIAVAALVAALSSALPVASMATEQPIAIAIHGGAGTITRANLSAEQEQAYKDKLKQALDAGYAVLEKGGNSTDAVIAAIQIMEDSPLFNAGRGAVYTWDGEHELDASIMSGANGNAGAVAGVKTVKSPIQLARTVMDKSVHVMLSGSGAEQFAKQQGLTQVDNDYFDTEQRLQQLNRAKQKIRRSEQPEQQAWRYLDLDYKYGTVGAVALDQQGNLAAGTSTGGMTAKRYGRIGDSPIIGAGTWADNASCAISATGHGEYFIRYHVAADICARVKYQQKTIKAAGDEVIHGVLQQAGGTGGVIILDAQGNVYQPFNTEGMYRGYRKQGEPAQVAIYGD